MIKSGDRLQQAAALVKRRLREECCAVARSQANRAQTLATFRYSGRVLLPFLWQSAALHSSARLLGGPLAPIGASHPSQFGRAALTRASQRVAAVVVSVRLEVGRLYLALLVSSFLC